MRIGVIIPAAGTSTRFGGSDKLSQDLGGRPLLVRTIEAFGKHDEVGAIVVAGPPDDFDAFRERFGPTLGFHGAVVVAGGRTERWESVKLALDALPNDCTHIAVHDAARPAVDAALIARVFEAARLYPAVVPAVQVSDTIKRVAGQVVSASVEEDDPADAILGDVGRCTVDSQDVVETLDRTNLVAVQTPQVFDAEMLRRAYAQDDLSGVTDDASVVERAGETVRVVAGDVRNIKVTTTADLQLIRAILGVKAPAQRPAHKRF